MSGGGHYFSKNFSECPPSTSTVHMPKKPSRAAAAADAATWELIRAEEARSAKKEAASTKRPAKPTKAPQKKSTAGKKASKKNNKSRREPESDSDESD